MLRHYLKFETLNIITYQQHNFLYYLDISFYRVFGDLMEVSNFNINSNF